MNLRQQGVHILRIDRCLLVGCEPGPLTGESNVQLISVSAHPTNLTLVRAAGCVSFRKISLTYCWDRMAKADDVIGPADLDSNKPSFLVNIYVNHTCHTLDASFASLYTAFSDPLLCGHLEVLGLKHMQL